MDRRRKTDNSEEINVGSYIFTWNAESIYICTARGALHFIYRLAPLRFSLARQVDLDEGKTALSLARGPVLNMEDVMWLILMDGYGTC